MEDAMAHDETTARGVRRSLRLASLLALLQYCAHALLFLSARPTHGAAEAAVIDAMKAHRFEFSGLTRSYWDFYFGYGLLAILWGLVEVVLLWQLPTLAANDLSRVRPTVALLILANVAHAALAWTYFFPAPVIGDVVVAACLAWTFFASRHRERAGGEVACPRGASEGTVR
jgi:hypothetical protein